MAKGDWMIDAAEMQTRLCVSNSFFRDKIATDPRIKALEIKRSNRKSWWETDKVKPICIQIMYECES